MSNVHGFLLEKILLDRGFAIEKVGRTWIISKGNGKRVSYWPANGIAIHFDPLIGANKREELRGSPDRIAEILGGFVQ